MPESQQPDISIIIPCYNDADYLPECIQSIPQSMDGISMEVILVNDGSTEPRMLQLLKELEIRYTVIHQPNSGAAVARNTGIAASKGKYILPVDADNRIVPDLIKKSLALLNSSSQIDIIYTDAYLLGEETGVRTVGLFDAQRLLTGNYIDTCAVFRREVWEQTGGYDVSLSRLTYEDWEFWIHAYEKGFQFYYIPEPLYYYRVKPSSRNTVGLQPEKRKEMVLHIVQRHKLLFETHLEQTLASLHAVIAHWEGPMRFQYEDQIKQLRSYYEELLQTTIANFERHIKSLEQGWDNERQHLHHVFANREAELHRQMHDEINKIREQLNRQIENLKNEIAFEKTTVANQQIVIKKFEERIRAIESTRTWRLRRAYYKMRNVLKSPRKKGFRIPGLGFIKKIIFFTLGKGRIMTRRLFKKIFKNLYLWLEEFPVRIVPVNQLQYMAVPSDPYEQWRLLNAPREAEFKQYKKDLENFSYQPLISVILPVYNTPVHFLKACINSVLGQIYENWELCIADDASPNPEVKKVLEEYRKKDYRIKIVYRFENGHISQSSNSALELAEGEFSLLLDHDDELSPDCLYEVVKLLNENNSLDLIYSDEDKIDENGKHSMPHFKPQWCPDSFLSRNYIGHVVVCRTSILKKIGGFRVGFEGSQDYDMLLRFTEQTQRIARIPKILYHWRIHAASTASVEDVKPYAYEAARKALTEACLRRGEEAEIRFLSILRGYYAPRYKLKKEAKISIIIPTKDQADVLETCIKSIFDVSTWKNFEVIIISNNSSEKSLFKLLNEYKQRFSSRFSWVECNVPFNFSRLMNEGVKHASGEYYLLLNNDMEVITPEWMEAMLEQAQRKSTGAVGVKLLYYNGTIQHAGVVIGLGGVAGHAFVGQYKDEPGYFNYLQCINNFSAVTAACLMVAKEKYHQVGGFDEKFEIEFNDVDFCLRLREAGYHNIYLPHVELYHYESLTRGHPHLSKESYDRHVRELTLFKQRWQAYVDDDPCYSPNLTRGAHDFSIAL
jgi:glycosyltransferase involved in cell wall biosynthesis